MTATPTPEPTAAQVQIARYADAVEATGEKTSMYYRLWPQIVEARATIARAKGAA